MVEARHAVDLTGHRAPGVEQQQHGLVALGAVGPHDDARRASRRRPVDAAALIVDAVLAQRVELGAAPLSARRAKPDFEDARPVDAQLGLLSRLERWVHAEETRQLATSLAGRSDVFASNLIKGRPGTKVTLVVRPAGGGHSLKVTMTRAAVDNYMGRDSSNTPFRLVMLNYRTGSGSMKGLSRKNFSQAGRRL